MTNEGDGRLVDLLRRTMASREPHIGDPAAQRVQDRLRTGAQRSRGPVWMMSGAAVAAAIAAVFVWTSPGNERADEGTPPTLGPGGCGAPEARIGPRSAAQQTWTASTGNPVSVEGGLLFGTAADPPEQKNFRFTAVTLIVGEPGAVGSPTALASGTGVLASTEAVVRDGQAPTKGRVVFETLKPGNYPVWVLVEGTCGEGRSLGASPVGFVQVERSVATACKQVQYDGRRYFLSTSPELGPGTLLGTGTGIDCEGGASVEVQVASISELSPAAGINVLYPGLGVRPYYLQRASGPDATESPLPTPRDWQGELRALLTGAEVDVLGAPEEPFNSGFLEGRLEGQQVIAMLFDEPVRGLPGRFVRSVRLGGETGDLFEASARDYIEFSCGPKDRVQVSVLRSGGDQLDVERTTTLAAALAASAQCQR